ncbi:hypothetical protein LGH82_07560 [Mesorhizobium sp. PAMC28654]|uniref:hypothetical protein n=1 Tax=Mesorhizobium sp. PAMC28654 TaxID=2880934 RepID=UPI001D0A7F20|nr:hypothetical protein [Mesorhizobium sp. PAMC28654]UDL91121.1 hypothetical protein LGH82_07560 [Mesorhizobium sp. PAMC28654]
MLLGRGVHERARLAPKRDQQKWNPVLRPIALDRGIRDQQKWNPVLRPIALPGQDWRSAKMTTRFCGWHHKSDSEWRCAARTWNGFQDTSTIPETTPHMARMLASSFPLA